MPTNHPDAARILELEGKVTPLPWKHKARTEWPFGVLITSADETILDQSGICHSSAQKTFDDFVSCVGFQWKTDGSFINREEAMEKVRKQLATGEYIVEAANLAPKLAREVVEAREVLLRCKAIFNDLDLDTFEEFIDEFLAKGSSNG